jgi:hypothetical protein
MILQQLFFDIPENPKLVTIIEAISATRKTILLYIILQGRWRMENWFNKYLALNTTFDMSDSDSQNVAAKKQLGGMAQSFFCHEAVCFSRAS